MSTPIFRGLMLALLLGPGMARDAQQAGETCPPDTGTEGPRACPGETLPANLNGDAGAQGRSAVLGRIDVRPEPDPEQQAVPCGCVGEQ